MPSLLSAPQQAALPTMQGNHQGGSVQHVALARMACKGATPSADDACMAWCRQGQSADSQSRGDRKESGPLMPRARPHTSDGVHRAGCSVSARPGSRGEGLPGAVYPGIHQHCKAAGCSPVNRVSPLQSQNRVVSLWRCMTIHILLILSRSTRKQQLLYLACCRVVHLQPTKLFDAKDAGSGPIILHIRSSLQIFMSASSAFSLTGQQGSTAYKPC